MSNTENYDNYAGIQFRNVEKANLNGYGNDRLRIELGRLGMGVLIIPNEDAYDIAQGTVLAQPVYGDKLMSLGEPKEFQLQNDGLEVIRSRITIPEVIEEQIPVLNGQRLRTIGASKWAQYELASDFMPKTIAIEDGQVPKVGMFDELRGDSLVVKADMSSRSKYTTVSTRNEVINSISAMKNDFIQAEQKTGKPRNNKRIIVQEFVPGLPWSELRATDEHNRQLLKDAETTELRIYCYVDRDKMISFEQRYFATARAMGKGYDEWVSVDQESVPSSAWGIADDVSDRLLAKANVPGGFFAVDLIKGRLFDDLRQQLFVREINTRDPLMVERTDNVHDFMEQRRLLANAMTVISKS